MAHRALSVMAPTSGGSKNGIDSGDGGSVSGEGAGAETPDEATGIESRPIGG